jgi:hypothetical protein
VNAEALASRRSLLGSGDVGREQHIAVTTGLGDGSLKNVPIAIATGTLELHQVEIHA